jgi:hypothetical protein
MNTDSILKDGALERRFQKIIVEPTSVEETITILNNIKTNTRIIIMLLIHKRQSKPVLSLLIVYVGTIFYLTKLLMPR